jgi:hypothetical protein
MVESMCSIKLDTTSEKLSLLTTVSCLLLLLAAPPGGVRPLDTSPPPLLRLLRLPAAAAAAAAAVDANWRLATAAPPLPLLVLLVPEPFTELSEPVVMPACRCSSARRASRASISA